jgi:hypothetical protein
MQEFDRKIRDRKMGRKYREGDFHDHPELIK